MTRVTLDAVGPGATVQDMGRRGFVAQGLSRGGAADRLALLEAAALVGGEIGAALELAGGRTRLTGDAPLRVALTGAPMRAQSGGRALTWNAVHWIEAGDTLTLDGHGHGVWSYVSFGGGIAGAPRLGSLSAHLTAGIGAMLAPGETLEIGADRGDAVNRVLDVADRFSGGELSLLPSAHTALFDAETRARFAATVFTRSPRSSRQGTRLDHDGPVFATAGQLSLISEIVTPGDIQMAGDGTPYLLGPECQTTGGYPRIGAIAPMDLPRALQCPPGATLRFRFDGIDAALARHKDEAAQLADLRRRVRPLVRDPRDMDDLGSYQLISGVTAGRPDQEEPA
ncbi:biotin-dependent carboxyltransferase [Palleronia sediminis]|uniref:Biotin-dependent carboxyltransferase n=1 Tax=Palleronia sediminis TaxID=2547833 RepID=A0A4R6AHE8_9RHOB|nr:biotin-dependent carboxyltransferase family protein [Palleronia sediminis]TDL81888.1 biotin-dependent carboxyltransferase [Palleronia sediminis]